MVCLRAVPADRIQADEVLEIGGIFRRSGGTRNFPDSGRRGSAESLQILAKPCRKIFRYMAGKSPVHATGTLLYPYREGSLGGGSDKVGFSHFPPLVVVVICGA